MPTPTKPLNALILAAVSANEQADPDKFSLDAQINDSLAVADKNGWHVIDTIRIEGHSRNYRTLAQLAAAARINSEPGFDKLIQHLEKKTFDVLIVRDANRFARKASLLYEIVDTILEDVGARIYSLSDGWVDTDNADMWLMVKGYEIRKQMNWLKKEMIRGKYKLVDDKGFPLGYHHVWSHMKVRDEKFKVVGFIPNPDHRLVIEDAARLVIERVSWYDLEDELFNRCGHLNNGQPFKRLFFYNLFYNPWFWGDAARNYNNAKPFKGRRIGLWCIDASQPVPEGVVVRRGINQPALTGELALQLKAELIRRKSFKPREHRSVRKFSGLLVCKRCGYRMVYISNHGFAGYNCQSKTYARVPDTGCERKWYISELKVMKWFTAALNVMLAEQRPFLFVEDVHVEDDLLDQLKQQASTIKAQANRLIDKQVAAPASLADTYDAKIQALGIQLDKIEARIDEETRSTRRFDLDDIQSAYNELTTYETIERFWQAENGKINQILHRLMGNRRFTVINGTIDGSVERQ